MYLPNFDLQTDAEIAAWIHERVVSREKESLVCDYKQSVDLTRSGNGKLAAHISGFANEIGGVILIGISEQKDEQGDNTGIPSENYGITPETEMCLKLESVIRESVTPALPALTVREVPVGDSDSKKVVYLVYHPKSWARPHYVVRDDIMRYYRRAGDRTVPMQEHEIEALYSERSSSEQLLSRHLASLDYGEKLLRLGEVSWLLKLTVIPLPYRPDLIDIFSEKGRRFFKEHKFVHPSYGGKLWVPDGDSAISFSDRSSPHGYVVKIYRSGIFTYTLAEVLQNDDGTIFTQTIAGMAFHEYIQKFFIEYFRDLHFTGDISVKVECKGVRPGQLTVRQEDIYSVGEESVSVLFTGGEIVVEVETSSNEMITQPERVKQKLEDRLANRVGMWSSPRSETTV